MKTAMLIKKSTLILSLALMAIMATFFLFGLQQLSQFETSDEYLWKYTRIPQYWDSLKKLDWEKTYINDKPGVSLALISGIGLWSEPHPENHIVQDEKITKNNLYTAYDISQTEKINFSLRFPILLFNTLFLLYFFWIIRKITSSSGLAVFATALIALSPPLIGISQIINPDAFLWSFSSAAFLTFLSFIKKPEKKLIIFCGILCGFSLLSKYTGNILFPSFLMIIFINYISENKNTMGEKYGTQKYWLQNLLNLLFIFAIACVTFSIFLPAVFVNPKILYSGTIGFSGFRMILLPLLAFIALLIADIKINKSRVIERVAQFLVKNKSLILRIVVFLMLSIFAAVIINVLAGQKIIPFDNIQDTIYAKGKSGYHKILKEAFLGNQLLIEFYPLVFSLPLAVLSLISVFWIWVLKKGETKYELCLVSILLFTILYFIASALSQVLTNVRYSILLYPLFSFLAALGFSEMAAPLLKKRMKIILAALFILIVSFVSIWRSKPHYLSYVNSILPKKFNITDSWGYGSYEAAQYLNSLPYPEDLTIWTNRKGVCQFFKGKCIKNDRINLSKVKPDYFVISRRGYLKNNFSWADRSLSKNNPAYYYEKIENDFVWKLDIGDRPSNYVKIIKSEE